MLNAPRARLSAPRACLPRTFAFSPLPPAKRRTHSLTNRGFSGAPRASSLTSTARSPLGSDKAACWCEGFRHVRFWHVGWRQRVGRIASGLNARVGGPELDGRTREKARGVGRKKRIREQGGKIEQTRGSARVILRSPPTPSLASDAWVGACRPRRS